ncbi:AraC family transcriptional regulator [Pseudomarimonas arenosa]|uniref:AraC family transcriptional regulator n=1 Tax=Pseudomarimonas arenosa TaxID=2774145 RepID=A0AAW3ZI32_9GAMM|nr:AraC family transcriptional regulator [Pseudomarimonas arenosa]MBD8524605.1 AraC family transcriptional regulator [Pseudomarimonas arenosa]
MDTLAGLLDAPRARGAFALRTVMSPPWSLRIQAESPVTLIAAIKGEFWILPDQGEPIRMAPGDVALTRAPDHYNVADSCSTQPQVVIHPGQECRDLNGQSMLEEMTHGVRTWGNDPNGRIVFIVGAYEHLSDISDRLLRALPPALSIAGESWDTPLIPLLSEEVTKDENGQAAVLDRLLDLLVTAVLKTWFARQDATRPDWWRHQGDRVVDRALKLMHERPAEHWTVDLLAQASGASRAAFAKRFQELVGEAPMTFLKHWRMALAADLLNQPDQTVTTVAEHVGYATPYAFSAAFKRVRGISPQAHRDASRQSASVGVG